MLKPLIVAWFVACAVVISGAGMAQTGTGDPAASARIVRGQAIPLGHGMASTWVAVDRAGYPLAAGMTLTERALTGLPTTDTEYVLPPPRVSVPPFTHYVINWNPRGHDPMQFYGVPHFDFHFYIITPQVRAAMTGSPADMVRMEKRPPARYVPAGYIATPGGIPHMGAHWINPASPEFHGQPFTQTFIYGFYDGRLAFLEPMASVAFFQSDPAVQQPIPQPSEFLRSGYYPTDYTIMTDSGQQTYDIVLQGLTWHRGR